MMKDKWQVLGDATQGEETAAAVIVAAGKGLRMGTTTRKQYLAIAGVPLLSRTLMVFNECPAIVRIIAVVPEEDLDYCAQTMSVLPAARKPLDFIAGGEKRQDSVYEGICAVDDPRSIVVVHDGVRPFVTESEIIECIRAARLYGAAVLGIPAQDTLKSVDDHGRIEKTIERSRI
jgi:2-C-methyl-D-erythritol 4-phosphate cytidylyltransferase